MKRIQTLGTCLILALMLLIACAPKAAAPAPAPQKPAAAPAPAPAASIPAASARPAWEQEWERTVQAAKKEGTVVLLTSTGPETRRAASEAFKSRFGINIEFLAGSTTELGVRVVNERRARIYSVDVGVIGFSAPYTILKPADALEPLDNVLFLPELTDPKEIKQVWRFGKLMWVDKAHTMLSFSLYTNRGATINTKLVKPGEIKAYRDLLNPKWKGKIAMYDVTMGAGPGSTWVQPVGDQIMGWDYMRKLAEQEPVLTRDARLLAEWIAHGKYAVGIALRGEMVKNFRDIGAPIEDVYPEEGVYTSSGPNAITLIKDRPHPNAAKLLINWLLSKDGSEIWCGVSGYPSARADVSAIGVDPEMIPVTGKKYVRTDIEETLLQRDEAVKKANEIFGKLKK